jgi:hypothetical protein
MRTNTATNAPAFGGHMLQENSTKRAACRAPQHEAISLLPRSLSLHTRNWNCKKTAARWSSSHSSTPKTTSPSAGRPCSFNLCVCPYIYHHQPFVTVCRRQRRIVPSTRRTLIEYNTCVYSFALT